MSKNDSFRKTTGTYKEPYTTQDGTEKAKFSLSLQLATIERVNRHLAGLPLGTTKSAWVEQAIEEKLAREEDRATARKMSRAPAPSSPSPFATIHELAEVRAELAALRKAITKLGKR